MLGAGGCSSLLRSRLRGPDRGPSPPRCLSIALPPNGADPAPFRNRRCGGYSESRVRRWPVTATRWSLKGLDRARQAITFGDEQGDNLFGLHGTRLRVLKSQRRSAPRLLDM